MKKVSKLFFMLFPQALVVVIILGWLFVPIYIKAGVWLHFSFLSNKHCWTILSNTAMPICQQYNDYDPLIILSAGCDHARVPEEEVWWPANPHLPLCAVAVPLCFHQNFGESKICVKTYKTVRDLIY